MFWLIRPKMNLKNLRSLLVNKIYADTNDSIHTRSAINRLLKEYNGNSFVLNIGSGNKRIAPHVKNLDISSGQNIDYVCDAANIPIDDNSVDFIIFNCYLNYKTILSK